MANELDIKQIDRRTVQRYLSRGFLDQKEYDKYLKQLPDLADKADLVGVEQPADRRQGR